MRYYEKELNCECDVGTVSLAVGIFWMSYGGS